MDRRELLRRVCHTHGIAAVYLLGSRADDGLRLLDGAAVDGAGSDLDVGLLFTGPTPLGLELASVQISLDHVFDPMRVDVVLLDRVDSIFQFRAIDGHRVFAEPTRFVDLYELEVMRRAAELLPIQRRREREMFGVSTT